MLEKKPYFSVVIPLYNKGPHVQRSVGSVLGQSFSDFELIIVNDASTDNSVEEVLKFKDERIRLLHRNKPGSEGNYARNLGIEKANGQWIALLDADDEWFPEHLEKMHNLAGRYPGIYFMACGSIVKKGERNKTNSYYLKHQAEGTHIISLEAFLISALQKSRPVNSSVACIKSNSPVAMNLFPVGEEIKRNGDLYAWLRLICFYKKMAWSNHLGAIIHRDSINMVSNAALGTPFLFGKNKYRVLSNDLNIEEKKMLSKYFNRLIKSAWLGNVKRNKKNFNLLKVIYWESDFLYALRLAMIGITPSWILKKYLLYKNK